MKRYSIFLKHHDWSLTQCLIEDPFYSRLTPKVTPSYIIYTSQTNLLIFFVLLIFWPMYHLLIFRCLLSLSVPKEVRSEPFIQPTGLPALHLLFMPCKISYQLILLLLCCFVFITSFFFFSESGPWDWTHDFKVDSN